MNPNGAPSLRRIETLEREWLKHPQVPERVTHHFGPGMYLREAFFPAGSMVIGHCHKTACFNILSKGRLAVLVNGELKQVAAPYIVLGEPWTRKVALILEDVVWINVHPTDSSDLKEIEAQVIEKSETFLNHEAQLEADTICDLIAKGAS